MKRLGGVFLLLACAAPALAQGKEDTGFFFKDGDRVVMMGDSITEQHLYSNFVEMWTVTRFPTWNITFRNVGIGGDRSGGGNGRFTRDVLIHDATALTVDFGMNDGGYTKFNDPGFQTYMKGLQGIADQAKKAKIRVAWITPQPLEPRKDRKEADEEYNRTLEKYSSGVADIAKTNDGLFVDQFHPYQAVYTKASTTDKNYTNVMGGDPVHPAPSGQVIMAAAILQGMKFPTLVSSAAIDAKKMTGAGKRCKIDKVKVDGDSVSFERLDEALPFFPTEAAPILKWSPVLSEMNVYTLEVSGLKEGKYTIKVDGVAVLDTTADELAKGVNLAGAVLAKGPISDQVKAVRKAIEDKNRHHSSRIFGVARSSVNLPEWLEIKLTPAEIEAKRKKTLEDRLKNEMPKLDEAVKKSLEIKPHKVEIVPASPAKNDK